MTEEREDIFEGYGEFGLSNSIHCPNCNGTGLSQLILTCPYCDGTGDFEGSFADFEEQKGDL